MDVLEQVGFDAAQRREINEVLGQAVAMLLADLRSRKGVNHRRELSVVTTFAPYQTGKVGVELTVSVQTHAGREPHPVIGRKVTMQMELPAVPPER